MTPRTATVDATMSRAEWLAEWTAENRGLCRICNAAMPTAEPLHCPTGCDLEPAYQRGSSAARALSLLKSPAKAAPRLVRAPTPPAPVDPLTQTSADGQWIAALRRVAKKTTPALSVRVDGVLVLSEELAIGKPKVRDDAVSRCPELVRAWLAGALLELADAWSVTRHDPKDAEADAKPRLTQDVEPWPEPVDARAVLDSVLLQVRRHVALPEHGDIVLALWIAHTHWIQWLRFTPYLWLTSPTKQCGKTTVLEVTELLCPKPWRLSNPTGAAMFRVIQEEQPTLLLDEIDTVSGPRLEDLTGILNDGWHAAGKVARCVGDNHDVKTFSVFSAKALAGIGTTLQDATRSRCIRLPMARATGDALAQLTGLRTDRAERWAGPLRRQLARLAQDTSSCITELLQEDDGVSLPRGIDGRDAQAWEPLLAIADLAGDEWSSVARMACVALVQARRADDDGDAKIRLLRDVRDYFLEKQQHDTATSNELVDWLVLDESRGWAEYRGKALSRESLARLLKPFGVAPKKLSSSTRAWCKVDLKPVWSKYLEPHASEQPAIPAIPATPAPVVASMARVASRLNGSSVDLPATDDGYWGSLLGDEAMIAAEEIVE